MIRPVNRHRHRHHHYHHHISFHQFHSFPYGIDHHAGLRLSDNEGEMRKIEFYFSPPLSSPPPSPPPKTQNKYVGGFADPNHLMVTPREIRGRRRGRITRITEMRVAVHLDLCAAFKPSVREGLSCYATPAHFHLGASRRSF